MGFEGYGPRVSRWTVWMIEVAFDVSKRAVSAYCHGTAWNDRYPPKD